MPPDKSEDEESTILSKILTSVVGSLAGIVIFIGVIQILMLLFLGGGLFLSSINEGERAVQVRFGEVVGEGEPGLNTKVPFIDSYKRFSIRSQEYTMSSRQGEGERMSDDRIDALTEEGLNIGMDITVRYKINEEEVQNIYENIARDSSQLNQKIVRPTIREVVRSCTSKYSVNGIYSNQRDKVSDCISNSIYDDFKKNGIEVLRVQIRNIDLPDKLEKAVEEKEVREQQIQARESAIEVEEKEKERKIVEAEAIAESNEIIANSISQNYLMWYWIDNLNTHDSVMYVPVGEGGMPMFKDIDNLERADGSGISSGSSSSSSTYNDPMNSTTGGIDQPSPNLGSNIEE